MYLEDYRNIPIVPNYDKPKLSKRDIRIGKHERLYHDLVSLLFLSAVAFLLFLIAYATGDKTQTIIGSVWIIVYVVCVCLLSIKKNTNNGTVYLLVDKIMELDEDIGLTQCLFILYDEDTDTYCKIETIYRIYREALIGDWVYMYYNDDTVFVIPEYPNAAWLSERKNYEKDLV